MNAKFLSIGLALVGLALLPGAAIATHSNGKGPKKNLVSGTGQLHGFVGEIKVHVNAKSGPNGEDPRGRVHSSNEDDPASLLNFKGDVTCVNVDGREATVAGVVREFDPPAVNPNPGNPATFFVEILDSGKGGHGADAFFPAVAVGSLPQPPPSVCGAFFGGLPASQGNFIVHDGSA